MQMRLHHVGTFLALPPAREGRKGDECVKGWNLIGAVYAGFIAG
jgi:hypothetical protein